MLHCYKTAKESCYNKEYREHNLFYSLFIKYLVCNSTASLKPFTQHRATTIPILYTSNKCTYTFPQKRTRDPIVIIFLTYRYTLAKGYEKGKGCMGTF